MDTTTTPKPTPPRCEARVFSAGAYSSAQCQRPGIHTFVTTKPGVTVTQKPVRKDGIWALVPVPEQVTTEHRYCPTHHPDIKEAKDKAKDAKRRDEYAAQNKVHSDAQTLCSQLGVGRPYYDTLNRRSTSSIVLRADEAMKLLAVMVKATLIIKAMEGGR